MQLPARFGKYILLKELEVGGMAAVYLGQVRSIGGFEKLVAIKKIFPHLSRSEEFVEMFFGEARLAAELSHPNVIHIYELGKVEGDYFIAMEYIHGKDAFRLLRRCKALNRALPLPIACHIVLQILEGLDYAHRKRDTAGQPMGIVHRDISPRNVLISYEGHVKLIDFGIAKASVASGHTQAGTIKGKINYMSPEQASGLTLDARSDLFAVGLLLYELIHQRRLFKGETELHTLERVRECILPPLQEENPALPDGMVAILSRALAKERDERPQSAREFSQEIQRFMLEQGALSGASAISDLMQDVFGLELASEQRELEAFRARVPEEHSSESGLSSDPIDLRRTVLKIPDHASSDHDHQEPGRPELAPGDLQTLIEIPLEATLSATRRFTPKPGLEGPPDPPASADPSEAPQPEARTAPGEGPAGRLSDSEPRAVGDSAPAKRAGLWPMLLAAGVVVAGGAFWMTRPAPPSAPLPGESMGGDPPVEKPEKPGATPGSGDTRVSDTGTVPPSIPQPAADLPSAAPGLSAGSRGGPGPEAPAPTSASAPAPPTTGGADGAREIEHGAPSVSAKTNPAFPNPDRDLEPHRETGNSPTSDAGGRAKSSSATPIPNTTAAREGDGERAPASASPPATVAAASSERPGITPGPPPPAAAERAVTEFGLLNVNAATQARVRIDGRDTGQVTPVKQLKVPVGSHQIELERLSDGSRKTYDVTVQANQVEWILWGGGQ